LIVIQEKEAACRRREIGKTASDGSRSFRRLMRIGKVNVHFLEQPWRAHGNLGSPYARCLDGERKEQVGVSDGIVIKKVMSAGSEGVHIHDPASNRNGNAEVVLFIPLPAQRQKTDALSRGKLQESTGIRVG